LLPLEDGFALLLSVAKYYTPNGVEIQEAGITPTVEVSTTVSDPLAVPDENTQEEDRQLDRAIEILLNPQAAADKAA
jgi:carboxyl-terminal processing protease